MLIFFFKTHSMFTFATENVLLRAKINDTPALLYKKLKSPKRILLRSQFATSRELGLLLTQTF